MITPAQIRAARSLLGVAQPELAALAGVSVSTLKRAEGSIQPSASEDAFKAIQVALEGAGVIFLPDDRTEGPGVRLRKP